MKLADEIRSRRLIEAGGPGSGRRPGDGSEGNEGALPGQRHAPNFTYPSGPSGGWRRMSDPVGVYRPMSDPGYRSVPYKPVSGPSVPSNFKFPPRQSLSALTAKFGKLLKRVKSRSLRRGSKHKGR